ncbi:helix-turn-helix domain-containing protein [Psychroflexus sp. MBR-150]|jgi:AraC-like DNA-binding protein
MNLKNNAIGSEAVFEIEPNIIIVRLQNPSDDHAEFEYPIDESFIQFHFCLKGNISFGFNDGQYNLNVKEDKSLLLYNPNQKLPVNLKLYPKSSGVSAFISLKKLHELFSASTHYIDFLTEDNRDKKYYTEDQISASMAVVLSQILNFNLHPSVEHIYLKAKVYELLGLFFNKPEAADIEQCPFLIDEDNVRKIKMAKEIVIQHMANPPSLQELSAEVDLGLKKLKEGFKEIYGNTVYAYILDHKMEYARKLLEKGNKNVNEIGLTLGYSTASHFITAFKKKFGTTPKKYLQSKV